MGLRIVDDLCFIKLDVRLCRQQSHTFGIDRLCTRRNDYVIPVSNAKCKKERSQGNGQKENSITSFLPNGCDPNRNNRNTNHS